MSSVEPRGYQVVTDARRAAREQARALSGGLVALLAGGVALVFIAIFVVMDYGFNQDPHRLVKILAGALGLGTMAARPDVGLLLLAVVTPFLGWMPKIPIPGVNPLNILLFTVFFAFAIPAAIRRESIFAMGSLGKWLLLIIGLCALSVVRGAAFPTGYTYSAAEGGIAVFRAAMTFTVYFIGMSMTRTPAARQRLTWAIVLAVGLEGAATVLYGRTGRGGRAEGSFGQANDLGAYLALFIVFAAAMLSAVRSWFGRLVLLASMAAGTMGLMFTISRGAMLALVVGLGVVAVRTSKLLTFALLALLVTSPLWTPDYVKERVMGTFGEEEEYDEVTLENSSQMRVDTWRAIGNVVSEHPLDGVGFTGLATVLPQTGSELGVAVKDSAHNTYLRFLAEVGILGLVLFVVLLISCVLLGRRAEREGKTPFDRRIGTAVMASTVSLALACAFGDRFFPITITGNLWLACAMADNVCRKPESPGEGA